MERENIGSLVRKLFFGLAGAGIVATGITGAVAMFSRNETPRERPVAVMPAKEKSDKYKALAQKYAVQVEAGRKYVAEKQCVLLRQVEAVVLGEAAAKQGCHDGIPDDRKDPNSSPGENLIYAVFKHQNGYLSGFISHDSKVHTESDFLYCSRKARTVVQQFLSHIGAEAGISSLKRVVAFDEEYKRDRWFKGYRPKSDELYEITITTGYGPTPAMCPSYSTYYYTFVFDAEGDFVVGRSNLVYYEPGVCTTEKEETRKLPLPQGLSFGNEPREKLIIK